MVGPYRLSLASESRDLDWPIPDNYLEAAVHFPPPSVGLLLYALRLRFRWNLPEASVQILHGGVSGVQ